ncbi:MAG TPA: type II/IV secretion system protein, partial [Candidatus Bathyarchaeia archaeon]|nr:type II/IV secretion system protein [Candidatus Bathyarchaeia archaeon]
VSAKILQESGFPAQGEMMLYEGKGCEACDFSGYHGREGIFEFFVMNDELREMVAQKASAMEIKARAVKNGMTTLLEDGWQKILEGRTTVSEVVRVTKEDEAL